VNAAPRHLSDGQLPALASLLDELDLRTAFGGEATIYGDDPVIRSPHRLATASATALLAGGAAAAAIWQARTGKTTDLSIDIVHALHHLHPTHFVEQMGYPCNVGAEYVATNGFFPTLDGTYLMIEAGPPYAKLQDGYLRFFDCANSKEALKSRIAEWDAEKLETALADAGLPGCRAFTREEWLDHPQGRALVVKPVVEIEKIADGATCASTMESVALTWNSPTPATWTSHVACLPAPTSSRRRIARRSTSGSVCCQRSSPNAVNAGSCV
jgi:crotonobetainyl-CoA:carnitine CoA-transferase CaiB-like acyl-CoA transferase